MKTKVNYAKGISGNTIELSAIELQVLKTKMHVIDAHAKSMDLTEINQELLISLKEMSTFIDKICGKEIVSLQEAEIELFGQPIENYDDDEEMEDIIKASTNTLHVEDDSAFDEERIEKKDRTTDI